MHPINGTEERLDLILDELRGLRAALAPPPPEPAAPAETVELREPAVKAARRHSARNKDGEA